MAQTQYPTVLHTPSGHRLYTLNGTHAFGSTAGLKITMQVHFRRMISAIVTPEMAVVSVNKSSLIGSMIPYASTTQFTMNLTNRKVVIDRKAGGCMLKFSYTFVGW
jgi:hypothetical protein